MNGSTGRDLPSRQAKVLVHPQVAAIEVTDLALEASFQGGSL